MSKQAKAGLTLPVSRINRTMKASSGAKRIGGSAPVYMTAVLEYVAAEILELAGNHTQKRQAQARDARGRHSRYSQRSGAVQVVREHRRVHRRQADGS